jgi:hypothetical protein
MNNRNYGKWLVVCALGIMGLSWDASFFLAMILGNGTVTISEPNTFVMWAEFIGLSLSALFVIAVLAKHLDDGNRNKVKKYQVEGTECLK